MLGCSRDRSTKLPKFDTAVLIIAHFHYMAIKYRQHFSGRQITGGPISFVISI